MKDVKEQDEEEIEKTQKPLPRKERKKYMMEYKLERMKKLQKKKTFARKRESEKARKKRRKR